MTMTGDLQAGHRLGAGDAVPVTARDAVNSIIKAGLLNRVMSQVEAGEPRPERRRRLPPRVIKACSSEACR